MIAIVRLAPMIDYGNERRLVMFDVYIVDEYGNCNKVNPFPFSLRDLEVFLEASTVPVKSILLFPAI